MTVRLYRSTDFGAPVLNGVAGALVNLLDKCLIDGFGAQAVTITRTGSVATITTTSPHGLVRLAKYTISGADQAEYNGDKSVTVTGANTLTFVVSGTPATPATGTVAGKLAGAGWSKAFAASNKAAYKQGAGSNGFYMRIDDTGIGGAGFAKFIGYEQMTTVDVGTAAFPTEAQQAGGLFLNKSSTADAVARPWVVLATEKLVYFSANMNTAVDFSAGATVCYGDILSLKPGDAYGTLIAGNSSSSAPYSQFFVLAAAVGTSSFHYMARSHTQIGSSIAVGKLSATNKGSSSSIGSGGLIYPQPSDNALHMASVEICEAAALRGTLPGLWNPLHTRALSNFDTFDGTGALAGKTFMAVNHAIGGQYLFEISDTW
jgi:hypothetical protein